MMDVQPIKCQKRLILHPIDDTEPPNKKIRYEPFETSQVVFNAELKSRKSKRSHDQNTELQNNHNFENIQPQSKVQKTNYYMNPRKETSNGFFDNSEIANSRKRKLDDSDDNFNIQEKYVKTNNNSDIELARKLPNTFKIHIEAEDNQPFLGNSLSNNSGFYSQHHHQYQQQEDDINMEISPDPLQPTAEYVKINSVLNDYYYERLARGKHVHAPSPTKKFWSPEFNSNAKGLNL
jgi:hypothetical protein